MSNIVENHVEKFLEVFYPPKGDPFPELREYAKDHHVPIIERECGEFLSFLLKIQRPERILELGTAIGYSALLMCRALPKVKELITVERREDMAAIAEGNFDLYRADSIRLIRGDALEVLDSLEGPFDFIFIDAAKGQYRKYFEKAVKILSKEGIILCDNVLFHGMLTNRELFIRRKVTIVKRLRAFLLDITEDPNWEVSLVTMGDGMLLVRRSDEKS